MSLRQLILNADNAVGFFLSLKLPAFIQETILLEGTGPYTQQEWTRARQLGYREAGLDSSDLDEDAKYLARMFQTQYRNLISAKRLCQMIDFTKFESVLEIGCGEMVQAFVITALYPHLRYLASDIDPYIIRKCSRLPLLRNIEKRVLDVSTLSSKDLRGTQLVLSWELFYALNDDRLLHLFHLLGEARISMLVSSTQLTGPLRAITRWIKGLPSDEQAKYREGFRMHGWHHSLGYYQCLAKRSGLKLKNVWYPAGYGSNQDNFTFMLFTPKP